LDRPAYYVLLAFESFIVKNVHPRLYDCERTWEGAEQDFNPQAHTAADYVYDLVKRKAAAVDQVFEHPHLAWV